MMTRRSRRVDDRRHDLRPGQFRTAMTWGFSSGRMYGVEWLVVAVAFALDVATYLGRRALRE